MLKHFRSVDQFASFKNPDLETTARFVNVVHEFRRHYSLDALLATRDRRLPLACRQGSFWEAKAVRLEIVHRFKSLR